MLYPRHPATLRAVLQRCRCLMASGMGMSLNNFRSLLLLTIVTCLPSCLVENDKIEWEWETVVIVKWENSYFWTARLSVWFPVACTLTFDFRRTFVNIYGAGKHLDGSSKKLYNSWKTYKVSNDWHLASVTDFGLNIKPVHSSWTYNGFMTEFCYNNNPCIMKFCYRSSYRSK